VAELLITVGVIATVDGRLIGDYCGYTLNGAVGYDYIGGGGIGK
jgi:hypothetical protein